MRRGTVFALACATLLGACAPTSQGKPVDVVVPEGATLEAVADSLAAHGVIRHTTLFRIYARLRGDARHVEAGDYSLSPSASWGDILRALTEGRVVTVSMTIPEGFRLTQMAPRIAEVTGLSPDSVLTVLTANGEDSTLGVPGPGLEGYLFPDTYLFSPGVSIRTVLRAMVARYHAFWTPARVARRDSLGMTERQVVTLASIVQAEARHAREMPIIAGVYHNRLERHLLLQADPTVMYALGGPPRQRLLIAAIDSVAASPYNTYTHPGLPPGPIDAPGEKALHAALYPADVDYLYFVARPDGFHVFTRTLAAHERAKAETRLEWDSLRRAQRAEAHGTGSRDRGGASR